MVRLEIVKMVVCISLLNAKIQLIQILSTQQIIYYLSIKNGFLLQNWLI